MNKKKPPPPATSTVVDALCANPPVIFGIKLQPVTVAHIIALEKLGNKLVELIGEPSTEEHLQALKVLSVSGEAALNLVRNPAALTADIEKMAQTLTPAQLKEIYTPIKDWINASYSTRLPAQAEGGGPLAVPDSKASAGPLS